MCSLSNEITHSTIDVDAVRAKINDDSVRLIDVRREEEYNQGHIPNAVNLPLASLLSGDSPESVVKLFGEMGIGDSTEVVVYDDTFGALASRVAWTLQYIGHNNVALLEVTYSQWRELGLKTSTEKPNIKPAKHSLNLNLKNLAEAIQLIKSTIEEEELEKTIEYCNLFVDPTKCGQEMIDSFLEEHREVRLFKIRLKDKGIDFLRDNKKKMLAMFENMEMAVTKKLRGDLTSNLL